MSERKGVSPAVVSICSAASAVVVALLYGRGLVQSASIFGNGFCVVAYVVALLSGWRVAGTYPENSFIRLGWLAMCGNCLLSVCRHLALNPLSAGTIGSRDRVYLLSESFQLPALLMVLLGMLSIWWGVYRLGLGFRVRWTEWTGVALAATLVPWIFRNRLSHANTGHGVTFALQAMNLALLIGIAGCGLLLHGLSMQMGGGRLAVVMRCFAGYALTRCLLTLTQGNLSDYPTVWWVCFYAVPWIFAFAASYSCWLADTVKRSIRNQSYSRSWYEV
jgi:hypothetical protein